MCIFLEVPHKVPVLFDGVYKVDLILDGIQSGVN